MTSTCPVCGRPGVPLIFGRPVQAAIAAADAGEIALAGCFMPSGPPPNRQCPDQHQWRDTDDATNDQVLAILHRHGYAEPD